MGQENFDVKAWLAQGELARAELHRREEEVVREIRGKERELADVRAQIKRVEDILGEKPVERRVGVKNLVQKVVEGLAPETDDAGHDVGWAEDDLVRFVLEQDPLMKDTSIRSSLRRLAKDGALDRIGRRGHHRYRRQTADNSEVVEQADPAERIHTALVSAGEKGAHLNDLAWILGDEKATLIVLDEMLAQKSIESIAIGDGVYHYRIAGNTSEAPAISTRPLFGAEPPT